MGCSGSKSTAVEGGKGTKNAPKIVLHYFAVRARAEPIRLILHYGGIEFEDKRYTLDDWKDMAEKGSFRGPFNVLPYVEYQGEIVAQSAAILRFAAKTIGVAGENNLETAQADSIYETITEMVVPLNKTMFRGEAEVLKELFETIVMPSLKRLENQISLVNDGNTGFIVGKKVTHADFVLFNFMETIEKALKKDDKDVYENFPLLKGHRDKIQELPQLQKYLSSRPDLPM